MPIITISRGSYSRGKEVAEKLAAKLNFDCISRDVVLDTCVDFSIPELKLVRALHDPSSVLERFQHGKQRYLCLYRYEMFKHLRQDNSVYHGLAGHFLLRDIPHVLKVRITADMEDRVREEMKRENISAEKALYTLKKDDDERRRWGLEIHGADTWDSRLYDLVLHIGALTVDDAVEILAQVAQKPAFQATPASLKSFDELMAAAKIQTLIVDHSPFAKVLIRDGVAWLSNVGSNMKTDAMLRTRVENQIKGVKGITSVVIQEPLAASTAYVNPYHNI